VKISTVELEPNDILVFSCNDLLSRDGFTNFRNLIKSNLERAGIPDQKFIALDRTTQVSIIARDR